MCNGFLCIWGFCSSLLSLQIKLKELKLQKLTAFGIGEIETEINKLAQLILSLIHI